jgi:hypothetical protein
VTVLWIAPRAISALGLAQYYELDCSFTALKPNAYSIPMAVRANVGVPLGIVIAPSERSQVYAMFADALQQEGFTDLHRLPLLGDEGKALAGYEDKCQHIAHYFCDPHLLESLGSGTFVALLAYRLLFTQTRRAFDEIIGQTIPDCATGCRMKLISSKGKRKFCHMFEVHQVSPGEDEPLPDINLTVFHGQALWVDRGTGYGATTCTNHIEGFHVF